MGFTSFFFKKLGFVFCMFLNFSSNSFLLSIQVSGGKSIGPLEIKKKKTQTPQSFTIGSLRTVVHHFPAVGLSAVPAPQ